jgi:iron complex transport system permease protein
VSSRLVDLRIPRAKVSMRLSSRTLGVGITSLLLVAIVGVWAMTLGDFRLSVQEVVRAVAGQAAGPADFIVGTLRMPRLLVGIGVGFAFAASGAIFQGLVRNPLVSPDIIGVNAGASLAAVFFIVTRGPVALLPLAAFAGALVAAGAVYGLAWRKGVSGGRLVLVGIGINAMAIAGTTFLIVRFPIEVVSAAELWLSGTLYARGWEHVRYVGLALALLLPAALALSSRLRALQLGDDVARALGIRVELVRLALLAVASGLAAAAVAAAGPIGFLALVVPHIARMLAGPFTAGVLLLSGLLGALLVIASDVVAQHAFAPLSLPAGLVTAALGAPYFLFLLYRMNQRT